MIIATVGGLLFGLILKNFTDAAVPMLDSQLAAFSLLATYWTSRSAQRPRKAIRALKLVIAEQ